MKIEAGEFIIAKETGVTLEFDVKYTIYYELSKSLPFLDLGESLPLYQANYHYEIGNLSPLKQIEHTQATRKVLLIVTVILGPLLLLGSIIFLISLVRRMKKPAAESLLESN